MARALSCRVATGGALGWLPVRQSAAVAAAMNCRGAVEVILATVALKAGLIDETLFVALVFMAMATAGLSGPVLSRLLAEPGARELTF